MRNRKDADSVMLYALYNKEEEIVFCGSIDECRNFAGTSKETFYHAISRNCYLVHKYKIHKIGRERLKEKECSVCHLIKPINEFSTRTKANGKKVHTNICRLCSKKG